MLSFSRRVENHTVSGVLDQPLRPAEQIPPRIIGDHANLTTGWTSESNEYSPGLTALPETQARPASDVEEIDPLYLAARHMQWELEEDPGAAWELIHAANSSHEDTRAHARALLASSRHLQPMNLCARAASQKPSTEIEMKAPYDLELVENCAQCNYRKPDFFCSFSESALVALTQVGHKTLLPAGAILFVEGQAPRGMFIVCSGRVNLSTTSREGKILILKTAEAGEALGLAAAISNVGYEITAETATPCELNFIDRRHILELLQSHSEVGVQVAHCLSRGFQSAYRDIHDLVLTRSSAGKLARLLLSQSSTGEEDCESRVRSTMTHEEMAQRIGASRETVTRLLSDLKRKRLIRAEGATLIIRDRGALRALTV